MSSPLKDATHLYDVERRATHAERPGFRIRELQISPTQEVPTHSHSMVHDIFYVLDGHITLFLGAPDEIVPLASGELQSLGSYTVTASPAPSVIRASTSSRGSLGSP